MKATVKVRRAGQVTIPDAVRKAMNIQEGDFVELDIKKVENP